MIQYVNPHQEVLMPEEITEIEFILSLIELLLDRVESLIVEG